MLFYFIFFYFTLSYFILSFLISISILFLFSHHFVFLLLKNIKNIYEIKKIIMSHLTAMQNMARFIRYLVLGGFWTEKEERLGIGVSLWQQPEEAV